MREFMTWPSHLLHPLPDSLSDADGAVLEPLGVAIHALDLGHVRLGATVAVAGCGPIGLLPIPVLRAAGASVGAAFDPLPHRRAAAARPRGAAAPHPAGAAGAPPAPPLAPPTSPLQRLPPPSWRPRPTPPPRRPSPPPPQPAARPGAAQGGRRRRRARFLLISAASGMLGNLWALLDRDMLCWHDRLSQTFPTRIPPAAENAEEQTEPELPA